MQPPLNSPSYVLTLGGEYASASTAMEATADGDVTTFECWVKVTAPAASAQALMWMEITPTDRAIFTLSGDQLGVSWQGVSYPSADTRVISDGAWHQVALVVSNYIVTFYKDGVATADTIVLPPAQSGFPFSFYTVVGLGAINEVTPSPVPAVTGQLYQARVWAAARTTAQISGFQYVPLVAPQPDPPSRACGRYLDSTTPTARRPSI